LNNYEIRAKEEVMSWQRKLYRKPSIKKRMAQHVQQKINRKIPEKAHNVITTAIKSMVEATITGSAYMTKVEIENNKSLEEREKYVQERLQFYKKLAAAEGAGTGFGGIILGLADFPLLLSIKMKFLMECSVIYGCNIKDVKERIFLLYVFQVAFSSVEHKRTVINKIENWQEVKGTLEQEDWRKLQQEYRDHIDLIKLLQLVPGFGAIVGAYANHHLLDELGETAINCFRMRKL
jgi:DNA-binding protein YbaB/uncharacterized protein (DUF697 family)